VQRTETDSRGRFTFDRLAPGRAQLIFSLVNFATTRRELIVPASGEVQSDVVMYLALSAEVGQLLLATPMADLRRRHRRLARAVHGP
jgi:hypothetical protein